MTNENDSASRVIAAGALLHVLIDSKSQLAQQSLTWAYVALGSSNASTRELAVAALGQINWSSRYRTCVLHCAMKPKECARPPPMHLDGSGSALRWWHLQSFCMIAMSRCVRSAFVPFVGCGTRCIGKETLPWTRLLGRLVEVSKSGRAHQVAAAAILLEWR